MKHATKAITSRFCSLGIQSEVMSTVKKVALIWMLVLLVASNPALGEVVVYETNFDALSFGLTQLFPGTPGQDGWFSVLAVPPAFGEIQSTIASMGKALHEFTDIANLDGQQTIDQRLIDTPNLSQTPLISLSVDFYAHTSELTALNSYLAGLSVTGGPHPGFEVLGFALTSGNGAPKGLVGINVALATFNGVNNNDSIPVTVGQNLAWDSWHSLTVIADQTSDRYVSLTVDGLSQDLTAFALPRSKLDSGAWERGQLMEEINAQVIPIDNFGHETNDDAYWDNVKVTVSISGCLPCEYDLLGDGDVDGLDLSNFLASFDVNELSMFAEEFSRTDCCKSGRR